MIIPLVCHPDARARNVQSVDVEITMTDGDDVLLAFRLKPSNCVRLPDWVSPSRADGLWQTTCFEFFCTTGGGGYYEFNFSPSSQWAAYIFEGYRAGMRDMSVSIEPHIEDSRASDNVNPAADTFVLEVDVDLADLPPGPLTIGLSAVIEELDGTKSYWALRHPPGKPDFHHPDCFALTLP